MIVYTLANPQACIFLHLKILHDIITLMKKAICVLCILILYIGFTISTTSYTAGQKTLTDLTTVIKKVLRIQTNALPATTSSGTFQKFAEFNRLHLWKSKTFTNVCLRIILDNYFKLRFGLIAAFAEKVNESQNSCILLTNKGIYLTEQFTNPHCCFVFLSETAVALLFQC